jgi:dGTPase
VTPTETSLLPREVTEREEEASLQVRASRAAQSRGRLEPEPEDELRTAFQRDRDRVIHSKAFRRLVHKTQVFIAPEGDHYRTRLTHTLEVAQIARTIARALRVNEDLTEAIALAHDLGHPPFGHAGEAALDDAMSDRGGFRHDLQSLRVVEHLEQRRRADGSVVAGLNLTWEVRDGIGGHSKGLRDLEAPGAAATRPETVEGEIVRIADRVAYLHHDSDDAVRAGLIAESDVPAAVTRVLGATRGNWIKVIVRDIVSVAQRQGIIDLSDQVRDGANRLKDFLTERVYLSPQAMKEAERAQRMLRLLVDHYRAYPEEVPGDGRAPADEPDRAICDHIASMTDRFAIKTFQRLFVVQGYDPS